MEPSKTFKYFAYGSNMLTERIHINNPSARYVGIGTLKKYSFGFETPIYLPQKFGAIATVRLGSERDRAMGVVWEIDLDQIKNLDLQETGYKAIEVDVILDNSTTCKCRTYELNSPIESTDKRPHPFYKKICVEGAKRHGLPNDYIKFLESFEDNGETEVASTYKQLIPVVKSRL